LVKVEVRPKVRIAEIYGRYSPGSQSSQTSILGFSEAIEKVVVESIFNQTFELTLMEEGEGVVEPVAIAFEEWETWR
jgi:hypothetical protein